MRRTHRSLPHAAAIAAMALLLGCAQGGDPLPTDRPFDGPGVTIVTAPFETEGAFGAITNACYGVTVLNGDPGDTPAPDTVVALEGICADRYGDDRSAITYIAPCDASVDGDNYVQLVLEDLWDGGADPADPIDTASYVNPCPDAAPCTLPFTCHENADVEVTFNLTIMRRAGQGFFDIAVNFDDIFCSAKLDTCYADDEWIVLLHNPRLDPVARDHTAVFAFACTTGAGTVDDTVLHLKPIEVTCGDEVIVIDPSAGPGNVWSAIDPSPHEAIWQVATYRGTEELQCEGGSCAKLYWNVAVGFDPTRGPCTLRASATASTEVAMLEGLTPENTTYPFIDVGGEGGVLIADALGPVCTRNPLYGDGSGVQTSYTPVDEQELFCYRYDGLVASTAAVDGGDDALEFTLVPQELSTDSATALSLLGLDQPAVLWEEYAAAMGSALRVAEGYVGAVSFRHLQGWHGTWPDNWAAVGFWGEFDRDHTISALHASDWRASMTQGLVRDGDAVRAFGMFDREDGSVGAWEATVHGPGADLEPVIIAAPEGRAITTRVLVANPFGGAPGVLTASEPWDGESFHGEWEDSRVTYSWPGQGELVVTESGHLWTHNAFGAAVGTVIPEDPADPWTGWMTYGPHVASLDTFTDEHAFLSSYTATVGVVVDGTLTVYKLRASGGLDQTSFDLPEELWDCETMQSFSMGPSMGDEWEFIGDCGPTHFYVTGLLPEGGAPAPDPVVTQLASPFPAPEDQLRRLSRQPFSGLIVFDVVTNPNTFSRSPHVLDVTDPAPVALRLPAPNPSSDASTILSGSSSPHLADPDMFFFGATAGVDAQVPSLHLVPFIGTMTTGTDGPCP